jgi:hypothetical protein
VASLVQDLKTVFEALAVVHRQVSIPDPDVNVLKVAVAAFARSIPTFTGEHTLAPLQYRMKFYDHAVLKHVVPMTEELLTKGVSLAVVSSRFLEANNKVVKGCLRRLPGRRNRGQERTAICPWCRPCVGALPCLKCNALSCMGPTRRMRRCRARVSSNGVVLIRYEQKRPCRLGGCDMVVILTNQTPICHEFDDCCSYHDTTVISVWCERMRDWFPILNVWTRAKRLRDTFTGLFRATTNSKINKHYIWTDLCRIMVQLGSAPAGARYRAARGTHLRCWLMLEAVYAHASAWESVSYVVIGRWLRFKVCVPVRKLPCLRTLELVRFVSAFVGPHKRCPRVRLDP